MKPAKNFAGTGAINMAIEGLRNLLVLSTNWVKDGKPKADGRNAPSPLTHAPLKITSKLIQTLKSITKSKIKPAT